MTEDSYNIQDIPCRKNRRDDPGRTNRRDDPDWLHLGHVGVDSGWITVADPCYGKVDLDEITEFRTQPTPDNLGVLVSTPAGDGVYCLEALLGKPDADGRRSVRAIFMLLDEENSCPTPSLATGGLVSGGYALAGEHAPESIASAKP